MLIGINASFARKPFVGTGQVTVNFLRELAVQAGPGSGHRFVLYLEEDVLPEGFSLPENFRTRAVLPPWKRDDLARRLWWESRTLPRLIREDGCEAFLSLYQSATVVPKGVRHAMLVHDIIPKLFPEYTDNVRKRLYWRLVERAIARADAVMTVSEKTKEDLVRHLGIPAERIVPNLIDADPSFKKRLGKTEIARVLGKYALEPGFIYNGGGLEIRKNTRGVLEAYGLLLEKNRREGSAEPFPRLVVSGKLQPQLAPLVADVEKWVAEMNLSDHVTILGFVPQEDLPALYAGASMFVFPSFYEGFGLPVLEAMNQGTPVVTSNGSSLPEVGGDAVSYVDPRDTEALAGKLRELALDRSLRERLSRQGAERAGRFAWKTFVQKTLEVLLVREARP
jgi:glycosyltransferase involved in cell wall biosynthesis